MNILQIFVTKIHSAEHVCLGRFSHWELIVDTDCWGCIEKNKRIVIDDEQYQHIQRYGYYWG